jgi:hypothetical protein
MEPVAQFVAGAMEVSIAAAEARHGIPWKLLAKAWAIHGKEANDRDGHVELLRVALAQLFRHQFVEAVG